MNKPERIKMVKAMEFICRNLNNEDHIMEWLTIGVADGDIEYGDLSADNEWSEDLDYYLEDDHFGDLMDTFCHVMKRAFKNGGLYCDGVVSRKEATA